MDLVGAIAERSSVDVTAAVGSRRFGKHRWRSTGAAFLTGVMFVEVVKVQRLARWASAAVTHYTRRATLKTITTDFRKSREKRDNNMAEAKHN